MTPTLVALSDNIIVKQQLILMSILAIHSMLFMTDSNALNGSIDLMLPPDTLTFFTVILDFMLNLCIIHKAVEGYERLELHY
jgi:hypothetical protein